MAIPSDGVSYELAKIDMLFPVLHGIHGEDGAVQGAAEVARIPLAGCSILGSAVALDKDIAKRLLKETGVPVARSVTIRQDSAPRFEELRDDARPSALHQAGAAGLFGGREQSYERRRVQGGAR